MAAIILLTILAGITAHFVRRPVKRTVRIDRYSGIKFERSRREMAMLRSASYW